ncbi:MULTISPECIES: RagB/SusD family nutrient uptake outer membrane protein [unclassified Siphonobacter]|uniref:RagB/SusD family nutrient uptake outer membrane protein n=1 Tax=unclassified Siphonobacter TaxID=2635712 RepID=UPI00278B0328|nr:MULTISPECIES: RagB/SusD family nutrient uptake outer membrane protein [unclassified Siphonobacter]MDQ1089953.1 GTP:adenosylcobinamide-phosphate guanylyltransferase [Siphonobacter sp. SORGH_AS_1065]MDR6197728.1 GTP:adenosylcobinamide-phosphate guanylyltransferase [Siphonobacter sp. SORGH_AS_0500]
MKINRLLPLAVAFLGFSCQGFLDETNRQSQSLEDASKNAGTFSQLLARVYEVSRNNTTRYASDMLYVLEDLGTDIITRSSPLTGTDVLNDYVDMNPSTYAMQVYWGNQYANIAAANTVLDNADLIQGVDANVKSSGIGQAKFFRAWAYFNLVENYGGVPLVLKQINTSETSFPRSTEEEVYKAIVADLEDALTKVDDKPSEYGRVSKDAVRQLLSKVLLTRGYKTFAASDDVTRSISLAETVISSHPLESSFARLFSVDNVRSQETVFSYLFGSVTSSMGWGNTRHMLYKFEYFNYPGMTRGTLYQNGIGRNPTPFFYSLFDDKDQRAEATFRRVLIADKVSTDGAIKIGDTAIYFPKTSWTQAQISAKKYKVINPDQYFTNDGVTNVHYPMFKKFDNPGAPFVYADQPALGTRDMIMMRAGEAYLLAAEGYLKSGNTTKAASLLTTLRSRAGLTTALTPAQVTIDFILDERARELVGEVNRWMDLKRTGKLIERTLAYNPHAKLNKALTTKHLLRPIPQYEIDASGGSVAQNPNY